MAGVSTSTVGAGGRERTASAFVEDLWRLGPRFHLTLAARFDHWRRYRALSTTTPLARPGPPVVTEYPDESQSSVNPRGTLIWNATRRLDLSLAGYHSFRGPTLNELYRSFRVGNTVTLANAALRAERLNGGEVGARWRDRGLTLSSTAFWTQTNDPVANLTLTSTPNLITRQRQNLGLTRARGLELDAEARLGEQLPRRGRLCLHRRLRAELPSLSCARRQAPPATAAAPGLASAPLRQEAPLRQRRRALRGRPVRGRSQRAPRSRPSWWPTSSRRFESADRPRSSPPSRTSSTSAMRSG